MRFHAMRYNNGGWPPTRIEAIVSGKKRVSVHGLRAIDVSGVEYQPYTFKLDEAQKNFLSDLVKADVKAQEVANEQN